MDQELVPPAIERLKAPGIVDIVNKNAAVGTAIERDAEGLETFLPGGVPKLPTHAVSRPVHIARGMTE